MRANLIAFFCFTTLVSVLWAEDEDKTWRSYVEAGNRYVRAAEDATDARERRGNVERAAGQFQVATRLGNDKKNWRPLVICAEGYVRLVNLATGNDRDTYTDLANTALDSATRMVKEKADRQGAQAVIRAYHRLARISAGAKLKAIESKIQSLEQEIQKMPEPARQER